MLRKKKLITIPIPECPEPEGERNLANVQIVDKILNINVFDSKKQLKYRFFCDGKNGIIYYPEKQAWDTCRVEEYGKTAILSDEEQKLCGEFCEELWGYNVTAERMINEYFSVKNSRKRREYNSRKYERMMGQINSIPGLPKNLGRFCDLYVLNRYSILFPKEKKKHRMHCLHCGHEVETETPLKHKGSWKCPHCKSETTVYKKAYVTSIRDKDDICVFQRIPGADIMQQLKIERTYTAELKPKYFYDAEYVEYRTAEKVYRYRWLATAYCYPDWHETKWESAESTHLYTGNIKALYPEGIRGVNLTRLKGKGKYNILRLLRNVNKYPAAGKLFKIGCFRLCEDAEILENKNGRSFEEATGLSSNYMPWFRKYNAGYKMLLLIRAWNVKANKENMQKAKFLTEREGWATEDALNKAKRYTSETKLLNYFYKQATINPDRSLGTLLDWYQDYMSMSKQLNSKMTQKIDLTATIHRFPRNIRVAHDGVSGKLRAMRNKEADEELCRIAKIYKRTLSFKFGNLIAVYPENINDFVYEGTCLKHCVGNNPTYQEMQVKQEYLTFFIRKKDRPDKPYHTATFYLRPEGCELKEHYGYDHKTSGEGIKEFLKKYEKMLNEAIKRRNQEGVA